MASYAVRVVECDINRHCFAPLVDDPHKHVQIVSPGLSEFYVIEDYPLYDNQRAGHDAIIMDRIIKAKWLDTKHGNIHPGQNAFTERQLNELDKPRVMAHPAWVGSKQ